MSVDEKNMKTTLSFAPNESEESISYLRMFVLGFIVQSPSILAGMTTMYPAVSMPAMNLNVSDNSWFASLATLSAPIGSLMIGWIIDKLGRRTALLCSVFPTLIGWIFLWWDCNNTVVFLGQIFNGVSSGAIGYPAQVYTGECIMINHVTLRNNYLTWLGIGYACGMCSVLMFDFFLSYQQIAIVATVISLLIFLGIYSCIPESPAWLYIHGRQGDAEWSQKKLRIPHPVLTNRYVIDDLEETSYSYQWSTIKIYLKKITRKDVYRPLAIMVMFFVITTFAGPMAIMNYMVEVIDENGANPDSKDSRSHIYTLISGILILAANISVCFVVTFLGTKKILIIASIFMSIGFTILGYTTITRETHSDLFTLHVISVWLVIFSFNFGFMNLPNAIIGDVFPIDAKGYGSVVCVIELLVTSVLLKIHPYLAIEFGGYLYYGYAVMAIVSAIYVATFMIETVGKTLEEINRQFL